MSKKIVVIGSGFAGSTAAAMLQKNQCEVTLLEAAAEWGGCSGKFQRGKFLFPVGATLAMGFAEQGIHGRINNYLNINVKSKRLDKVMDVTIEHESLPYYSDRETFINMWYEKVPDEASRIEAFFREVWKTAEPLKKHMVHFPVVPPGTFRETGSVLKGFTLSSLKLLPLLPFTLDYFVKKHDLTEHQLFVQFINGVLMDSMQTTYQNCTLLMGCMALDIYHDGVWYVEGGLYKLIESLIENFKFNGGNALKPRRATYIRKSSTNDYQWEVEDHRGNVYQADDVVINTPPANMKKLLSEPLYSQLNKKLKKRATLDVEWGTYTLYLAVKDIFPADAPLFEQIMLSNKSSSFDEDHFFVSLSSSTDRNRAPEGCRTITISTHINTKNWNYKEIYDQKAADIERAVINALEKKYPGFENALIHFLSGGPRAWERFTNRSGGKVGGFPQTNDFSLWRALQHRTGIKGLWVCGDNIFPGAGSVGASSSGVHAARSILNKRIF
ncbi:phytoene desaturase family protein [Alkalicoccus halolimnae]|uniref:FAD-dependent oxidoreductase n=1 Tax=Alkalicoccus halolimnae TaxID=1667239 RepID=A0A5C7FCI0_9BACI|nr:FAD-dependent oxidoreductase [Alkalicoccus halolimnae]TXF87180.1 FAD-dependent oxidoreductase [Alkalicoccus halolimnae]